MAPPPAVSHLLGDEGGVSVCSQPSQVAVVEEVQGLVELRVQRGRQAAAVPVGATVQDHLPGLTRVPASDSITPCGGRGSSRCRVLGLGSQSELLHGVTVSWTDNGRTDSNLQYLSSTTRSVAVSALLFKVSSRFWILCSSSDGSHLPLRMEAVSPRIRGLLGLSSNSCKQAVKSRMSVRPQVRVGP